MTETIVVSFRYPDGQENRHFMEIDEGAWPLPDTIKDKHGTWHKASESQLTKRARHVIRGVVYEPVVG